MDYILSPSILSADFANLGADVKEAVKAGAKWVEMWPFLLPERKCGGFTGR